jgi:hypothetical protein
MKFGLMPAADMRQPPHELQAHQVLRKGGRHMARLLSMANLTVGALLMFALSDIAGWTWFENSASKIIVFILSMLLVGNGIILAFREEEAGVRRSRGAA